MTNEIQLFMRAILNKHSNDFNEDDINNVKHYIKFDEYEMAFESLILSCIEHKIFLTSHEIDKFKLYINAFNLKENSVYVLNIEDLFDKNYNT